MMEREFSVTISVLDADLEHTHYMFLRTYFTRHPGVVGCLAYERGGRCRHWHAQGVCRVVATSGVRARNDFLRAVGWWSANPYGNKLHVLFRELSQKDLHTFIGMLGYCGKDEGEYDGWDIAYHEDITDDMKDRGAEKYAMYGAPEKFTVITLTRANLMDRVTAFWKVYKRRGLFAGVPARIEAVLLAMLRTGTFRPSGDWCVPRFGEGADHTRAQAMFRVYQLPHTATEEDVYWFFFYRQNNWSNRRSNLSDAQRALLFARSAREAEDPSDTPNLSKQGGSSGSGTTRTLGISQNSYRLHQMQEHQAMMMMCARTHIEGGRIYLLAK